MSCLQNILSYADHQYCARKPDNKPDKGLWCCAACGNQTGDHAVYLLKGYRNDIYDETFAAMSVYRYLEFSEQEQLAPKLNLANRFVAYHCG